MKKNTTSLKTWQQGRFGMFVHWGLYSGCDLGCWNMSDMGISVDEYAKELVPKFTGKKFDADKLAGLAKDAGCKYIVMGSRHHEGYCLWDTKTTHFSSVKTGPKPRQRLFVPSFSFLLLKPPKEYKPLL